MKLGFVFGLGVGRSDWLLADTCPQAAVFGLGLCSGFIAS